MATSYPDRLGFSLALISLMSSSGNILFNLSIISDFFIPPLMVSRICFPFSKNNKVGEELTPNAVASSRLPCLNIFKNLILLPYSSAIASNFGANASQGGHSVE
ncbi:hypothetical protein SDC9_122446 [bioreactor metagenome]|uniref:Uncharacterized protein n=1 Tax=bioreactor metagenome TaxID=1076179 RepID=A0A645CEX4_9ZZZZ